MIEWLVKQVLEPASRGKRIRHQEWDWDNNRVGEWRYLESAEYLIVEGGSVLHPPLLKYYHVKIWIDCPLDVTIPRGKARDRENGVDHDYLWENVWRLNDQDYFDKYRPDKVADIVMGCCR